jgi:hypothetical protein
MVQSGQHLCQWEKSEVGVFAGPDLSESGLVLALDAGNNKSHSTNRFISYGSGLVTEGVGFAVNGTGTFERVAAGTVIGGYTVKTTDVVYSYALGVLGCHYHGNTVPVPAGVRGTFSFDYFVTGATTYPINNYLANFEGTLTGAVTAPNSLQNVWQRVSFTSGISASSGTFNAYLYPGACGNARLADSGTIYYKNPRVEFTNVDTGTENFSSMPNLTTWYDLNNRTSNGTLTNTPYHFIGADGTNGYMSFDGTNDMIIIPENSALNTQTPSVEVWVKTNATTQNGFWFEKGQVNTQYSLFQEGGSIQWRQNFGGGHTNLSTTTANFMNTSNWYQVVGTFTSGTRRLYINGVLVNSDTQSGTIATNANGMSIGVYGGFNGGRGYYYNGNIASVKVYNRALTAAEIQQNFNATKSRYGL